MNADIIDKKSGSRRHVDDAQGVVLDRPSVIRLKLAPEKVARYERRGDDLVLVLKDGQEIAVHGFFVKYPDAAATGHAPAEGAAAEGASAEGEAGRNELVLEDDNGVVWWGQYPEQWTEFHFAEIEAHDGAFVWWPWLLGAVGGGAGIAALAGGSGGSAADNGTHPPVARDDSAVGREDAGPVTGTVLANDSDPKGDPLRVTGFTVAGDGVAHAAGDTATIVGVGTITLQADGRYVFTPSANWNGTVPTVTYTVSDGHGGSDTAELTITVTPVDDLTAADDSVTTAEDMAVRGTVASNDATTSGGVLSFAKASDPAHGTVELQADGTYVYTPDTNYNGPDSFTYTVTDPASGESRTQTVAITVTPVDDLTAADDSATTGRNMPVSGTVASNDATTSGGALSFAKASDPAHGTVDLRADGTYVYTPDANYDGPDSFTYTVTDPASGESRTQTVAITVTPPSVLGIVGGSQSGAVVEAGNLDDGTVVAGTPGVSGTFIAADPNPEVPKSWSIIGTPDATYGTFALDASGHWTYALDNSRAATQALNEGESVDLTYTVRVSDGAGAWADETVTITVTGTNDSPVAQADTAAVTEAGVAAGGNAAAAGTPVATGNVLANDSDVDAGETASLRVSAVGFGGAAGTVGTALAGTYGTLQLNADGSYSYTLDNADADTQALAAGDTATETFHYTTVDAHGATSTSTLTVTVTGANDRPVVTSAPADASGAVTEAGTSVVGTPTATGTLTSADVDAGATATWSVTATNGTYGTIAIDPVTGQWTYTLDDSRPATQGLNDGDTVTDSFTARVTDEHGAYSEQVITIDVHGSNDDVTGTGAAAVSLDEDGSATGTLQNYVTDVDNVLQVAGFKVDANGDGTDESYAPGSSVTLRDADGNERGVLSIATNGAYSFTPAAHYAGTVPTVTYTIAETGGGTGTVTQTLSFTIDKLSDAPGMAAAKTVNTPEDTLAALGLTAPVITDTGTGTANGDIPERLGAISLTLSGAGASGVTLSTGGTVLTPVGGVVRIVLTDQDHVSTVPAEDNANGVYYLTTAQYEALQARPVAESGKNFTVTVSASSYEVDGSGAPLAGVSGAAASQVVTVDVQAVTDGATLSHAGSTDLTGNEDGFIALTDLTVALNNADGNASIDSDGSETFWYSVSGLQPGWVVTLGGVSLTAGASGTVTFPSSTVIENPNGFRLTPPTNFSGDVNGVTVTLNARDTDADSTGTIAPVASSVSFNLHVLPVAGDVAAGNVTTPEDTAVNFLQNVRVTDTGTGSEVIDAVSFEVPAGWVVTPPAAAPGWTYTLTGSTATITFDGTLTEAQRETVLDGFSILPPAHSSADATIALSITSTDSNTVNGAPVSDTKTVARNVTVRVNAVAERIDTDSDGNGVNDVTMSGDHGYATPGFEDTWFDLSRDGSFRLADGWSDADSDETLYAVLTPTLSGAAAGDTVMGTQFRYSTDGGSTWITQSYYGDAVKIPATYLDTLQVRLPSDVSGTLTIGVQAGTSDTDPDTGTTVTAVSGSSTLSLIRFDPVADAVTMALNGRASGLEDTEIPLSVKTTSSDPSETFEVTISGIPAGAKISYNGVEQTVSGGSVTIADYSNSAALSVTPPLNSNGDFTLTVSAVSVDGASRSASVSRTIDVSVTGDADPAVVTLPSTPYTTSEAVLDSTGAHKVALASLVSSVASTDTDGSESVTLRVTGLAEGFGLAGATTVVSGTGTERVWLVSASNLGSAFVTVPANYSGTVALKVAGVTTENDGDSLTSPLTDVSFTVTPSPEATLTTAATLVEDQITPLGLAIVHQNGDTDETLGNVYIRVGYDDSNFTLYLGSTPLSAAGLTETSIGGFDYYVVPSGQVADLGAKGAANLDGNLGSLDVRYDITDPSTDNSLPAVTEQRSGSVAITATPVTDPVNASITGIVMGSAVGSVSDAHAGDDASPDTAHVTGSGAFTVTLHVDSADTDGSEHLIRVLIENVPDGVTVTGGSQVSVGTWLLVYDGSQAVAIGAGGIDVPVEYVVGQGLGDSNSAITMTVLAQDWGNDSGSTAAIVTDPVTWNLELALAPGSLYAPPSIDRWAYNGASGTEDTAFALSTVMDAAVSTSDASRAYSYTVTLTGVPEGASVTGMTLTYLGGAPVYTATVTVPAGGDSQAAVEALLSSISLQPPANSNDNNAAFSFDARLTAAAVGGPSVEADASAPMPITPVTDDASVSVATGAVDEGLTSVTATISAADTADGAHGTIVDGKLYVQVGTTNNGGGTVTDSLGTPLTTTAVSGVPGIADGAYYVIAVGPAGGSVALTYTAAPGATLQPGDVTFSAWARTQETGAANVQTASATGTAAVVIVNNGVNVTTQPVTGSESASADKANAIPLDGLAVALVDHDGSETIQSVLLSGLPVGFLLYVGTSASDATLATQASNAGGDGTTNTWVLTASGTVPAYVAILPPPHWSGTLDGLSLVVESGETTLAESRVDTILLETVTVNAVANGLTIDPTISFGTEGHVIDLNLNAAMADAAAATSTVADGSVETTTLQIVGLGAHAAFYVGAAPVASVSYDAASDTYTITGLAQDALDDLGFVQAASALTDQAAGTAGVQVAVTAWTVESGNGAISTPVSGALTVDVTPVPATTGDDSFLWTGAAIDGKAGTDTVALRAGEDVAHTSLASLLKNVEVIDLSAPGANRITGGLSIADVLSITGSSSGTLTINGDGSDSVQLSSASEWSTTGIVTGGHVTYTSSAGATLLIDEDIYLNHNISFAA